MLLRALVALGMIENQNVLVPNISSCPIARLTDGPPLSDRKRLFHQESRSPKSEFGEKIISRDPNGLWGLFDVWKSKYKADLKPNDAFLRHYLA